MPTLKELQQQHPVGTKFRRKVWYLQGYWVFTGIEWVTSIGMLVSYPNGQGNEDDWEVYQEPKKHSVWVNFVQDKDSGVVGAFGYSAEEAARKDDSTKYFKRLACIKVEFTEGEGL